MGKKVSSRTLLQKTLPIALTCRHAIAKAHQAGVSTKPSGFYSKHGWEHMTNQYIGSFGGKGPENPCLLIRFDFLFSRKQLDSRRCNLSLLRYESYEFWLRPQAAFGKKGVPGGLLRATRKMHCNLLRQFVRRPSSMLEFRITYSELGYSPA